MKPTHRKPLSLVIVDRRRCRSSQKTLSCIEKFAGRRLSPDRKARIAVPVFPVSRAGVIPRSRERRGKDVFRVLSTFQRILYMLEIADGVTLSKLCTTVRSRSHQRVFHKYLRICLISGIQCLRPGYWRYVSRYSESDQSYYSHLRACRSTFARAIAQDAERTLRFVSLTPMSPHCQQRLVRVLTAVSVHRKELGYCQGMNYVAAVLLQVLGEDEAFWAFNTLCEKYDFDLVFTPGMYRVRCVCNAINLYVAKYLPALSARLSQAEVNAEMYAAQWVMTLFAKELPLFLLLRAWDLFLLDGWKAVVRLTLAVLQSNEESILACSHEAVFERCLKSARSAPALLSLLHSAQQFKVTRSALSRLDTDYLTDVNLHTESTVNQFSIVQVLGVGVSV